MLEARCGGIHPPEQQLLEMGFYPELRRCEYVYCQNGPLTGSQLPVKSCFAADVLLQRQRDWRDIQNMPPQPPDLSDSAGDRNRAAAGSVLLQSSGLRVVTGARWH